MFKKSDKYDKYDSDFSTEVSSKPKSSSHKSKKIKTKLNNIRGKGFFVEIFSNKTILKKIGITLFVLLTYRALAAIPLPGINMDVYRQYFGTGNVSESTYLVSLFTGSQLDSPSIVGMGLVAYINSSIILQLLTSVVPKLEELSKEGQRGKQLINQYTRYVAVVLSFIYSISMVLLLSRRDLSDPNGNLISTGQNAGAFLVDVAPGSDWPSITKIIFIALILTAGSILLMWLSEIITESGIGNGASLIITVGIVSILPTLLKQDFSYLNVSDIANKVLEGTFAALTDSVFLSILAVIIGGIVMILTIVFVNESVRNIAIQYANRVREGTTGQQSSLPIKLTLTGVLPIIFASSLLYVPQLLIPFVERAIDSSSKYYHYISDVQNSFLFATSDNFVNEKDIYYAVLYFVMIVLFGLFYTFIAMKPEETAEQLQKSGAFIPGVRPGTSTRKYITSVLFRIGFVGATFLGLIALIPIVSRNLILSYSGINLAVLSGIGGTSILIIVSVTLETVRQINALRVSKSYEKYV